mmetsp:Transcript_60477/g.142700  ORF Transcript_60477/g.142700 Transcript_60477/m.142700 type:complete len:202 (-) Transcript_60477:323-928(-)
MHVARAEASNLSKSSRGMIHDTSSAMRVTETKPWSTSPSAHASSTCMMEGVNSCMASARWCSITNLWGISHTNAPSWISRTTDGLSGASSPDPPRVTALEMLWTTSSERSSSQRRKSSLKVDTFMIEIRDLDSGRRIVTSWSVATPPDASRILIGRHRSLNVSSESDRKLPTLSSSRTSETAGRHGPASLSTLFASSGGDS